MAARLEFEKPVIELQTKIAELKKFTQDSEMDLSAEIARLEDRLSKLQDEIYKNLKPWDRVQIARLPDRPTTLDYIQYLFTDFFECHGDRTYGDDAAIVGGVAKYHGMPVTVIGHQRGKDTKENLVRNFPLGNIKTDSLPEAYDKWRQTKLSKELNCRCTNVRCLGPNVLVKNSYYQDTDFSLRKARG
ncbi:hypothetical protein [Bacillus paralicheniformis]|uniref:hypothetical protein n=1 Tax=Bacillus paralicheniformis TaxID=1648923 RepID=UPI003BF99793